MGKIKITGTAKREVAADIMRISITVSAREKTPELAIREGKENVEKLLQLLVQLGIDITKVEMRDEDVSNESRYNSDSIIYKYEKELALKTKLDLALLEAIGIGISENRIAAEYSETFEFSGEKELEKEVLCEALADSKMKVDALVKTLGQAVKGIEEATGDTRTIDRPHIIAEGHHFCKSVEVEDFFATKLAPYIIEISKEIVVTWIVE